jgi:hypothetical protein
VIYHPEHHGEAFAAQAGRLFRSTDGGNTWIRLAGDQGTEYPSSLFFLLGAPYRLFALYPRLGILSQPIDLSSFISPATSHSHL